MAAQRRTETSRTRLRLGCVPGPSVTCDGSGEPAILARRGNPSLLRLALPCHRPRDQPYKRTHRSETDDLDHRGTALVSTSASSRPVASTYAARRRSAVACVTASLGSSILPLGALGDPFTLEYDNPMQTNKVATIA